MDCRVLLLGGPSGTGKTVLARRLARDLEFSLVQVDDLRLAVQSLTRSSEQPRLHRFADPAIADPETPEALCQALIGVAEALEPAVRIVMAHHLAVESAGPIFLEGDGLLPRLGDPKYRSTLPEFGDHAGSENVRAAFVIEPQIQALEDAIVQRGDRGKKTTEAERHIHIEGSWLFGEYLRERSKECGVPLIEARPRSTAADRILQAVGLSRTARIADA